MNPNKDVSLRDLLNYEAETYLSNDDLEWIRSTFKDNPRAIAVIRKCFLPLSHDLPIEELMNDVWFKGGVDWAQIPEENVKSLIVARQDVLKFIMGGLVNIKQIANSPREETLTEKALREKKNSSK